MSIGETIRDLRWDRRLKQGELARAAGIAQNTLSQIELGKTRPSVETATKLARVLGVGPEEILFPKAGARIVPGGPEGHRAFREWLRERGERKVWQPLETWAQQISEEPDPFEASEHLFAELVKEMGPEQERIARVADQWAQDLPPEQRDSREVREKREAFERRLRDELNVAFNEKSSAFLRMEEARASQAAEGITEAEILAVLQGVGE
jgi:transcriptional regulator with XRE-family HTH domain